MTAGLTDRPAWKALTAHYQSLKNTHLRQLFADDATRGQRMTLEAVGIYFDYSKNRITDETLKLLIKLAEECELPGRIEAMFGGEKINMTENRAVLHVALRAPQDAKIVVDGENVVPGVHAVLDKMSRLRQSHPQRRVEGAHRASGSKTSSTSASAAPIWGR